MGFTCAYAEMARFVRNHPYLVPLLGFTRAEVPCDDTFRYTLKQLDVERYEQALSQWAQQELADLAAQEKTNDRSSFEAYAADGKTLRGSGDKLKGQKAVHLLSLVHQHYRTVIAHEWFKERQLKLVPTNFAVEGFAGVKQVGRLIRYRYHKRTGQETTEMVYLITNLSPQQADAQQLSTWLRGHWTIENQVHRTRDVQMHEDASRVRQGQAPRVLVTLCNTIIGLLARRGYTSVKQATEQFCAKPTSALDLISRAI